MRLASRIADLKRIGVPIISETEKVKNKFGETCHIKRYRLADEEENPKKHFSPEEVRKMSQKEVRENYKAIMNSMKKW